jgi:hypothetical protein
VSDEGGPCYTTFKEKQNPTKYGKIQKKEGAKVDSREGRVNLSTVIEEMRQANETLNK